MTKLTEAQKTAQKKYDEKFPTLCVRLDRETYDWIEKYSEDHKIKIKEAIKLTIDSLKEIEQLRIDNDLLKKEIEQLKNDLSVSKKKEGFRFW